jgi:DNA recombination protein RmuC
VGTHLNRSVDAYNKSVGSLERNVLSSSRKFVEMGIRAKKEIEELDPIEKQVREVQDQSGHS